MEPIPVTGSHVAWWWGVPAHEPRQLTIAPPPSMPDATPVDAVVTTNPDDPTRPDIHVPWRPSPEEVAALAAGGTLWLTAIGGIPPVSLAVQPPDDVGKAWACRVLATIDSPAPERGPTVRLQLPAGRPGPGIHSAVVLVAEGAPGGPDQVPAPPATPDVL